MKKITNKKKSTTKTNRYGGERSVDLAIWNKDGSLDFSRPQHWTTLKWSKSQWRTRPSVSVMKGEVVSSILTSSSNFATESGVRSLSASKSRTALLTRYLDDAPQHCFDIAQAEIARASSRGASAWLV
jgi:hypothetical protein